MSVRKALRSAVVASLALVLCCSVACKPRGESKSLPEIVKSAQSRYRSALDGSSFPQKVETKLKKVSKDLESLLVEGTDKKNKISSVVDNLQFLTKAAGYTSRPAFGELIDQFVNFGQAPKIEKDSLALVVARTFFLLASELEGVRFQLYERELRK